MVTPAEQPFRPQVEGAADADTATFRILVVDDDPALRRTFPHVLARPGRLFDECGSIGGKGSRLDPGPVQIEAELVSTSDGSFDLEDRQSHLASCAGARIQMGRCAVIKRGNLTLLLTSRATPPFDLGQWRSQGIEPTQLRIIAVKAAVAHRRASSAAARRAALCSARVVPVPRSISAIWARI